VKDKMRETAGMLRARLLRERHQDLDDRIDKFNARHWLSTTERIKIKEWKVKRLRLRDQITELEKGVEPNTNV
jgi:hypothetical protein